MAEKAAVKRRAYVTVSGVVQGVGFRPFVAGTARRCGLSGFVRNDSGAVYIEAEGSEADIVRFLEEVKNSPPRGSFIEKIEINWADALKDTPDTRDTPDTPESHGFSIHESGEGSGGTVMPSPDISICEDCLRELEEPENPRCRNPFISCTLCGPRFSIMRRLPYDRGNTSMGEFPLCELCESQYEDADDRRCHAQTVCCNNCGPELSYLSPGNSCRGGASLTGEAALMAAADALKIGEVIAVKGIGGFHFACSPFREDTVRKLRDLKGREEKPFAVMFPSLEEIKKHCLVSREEEELLLSREKPIVLLERKDTDIAKGVYGSSRFMGSFLPYTPLQYLLLKETGPLVMTSANVSGLPIIKDDEEILAFYNRIDSNLINQSAGSESLPNNVTWNNNRDNTGEDHVLIGLLGGILTNNRDIVRRLDDSVTAVILGRTQFLRRARGYVPLPVTVPIPAESRAVLAFGSQQKNTISLSAGQYIYPSTEIGDLDSLETNEVYCNTIDDMKSILNIKPELAVCDLHPGYYSTQAAHASGLPVLPVQHHYAHIASVMAEAGLTESVIGVAFDGTGYGTDGTVWGGEFLIASPKELRRAGCLKPVGLFGSDESVKQGWKTAACYKYHAGINIQDGNPRMPLVKAALDSGVNTILSSSMGRLFDAVSAILNICDYSDYEGQCAIELENAAARYQARVFTEGSKVLSAESILAESLPYVITEEKGIYQVDFLPVIRALCTEADKGTDAELLAYRFHMAVCRMIIDICIKLREESGLNIIALSGGVFQNRVLLSNTVPALEKAGFTVYTNRIVPPGDGGISLGQAYIGRWA